MRYLLDAYARHKFRQKVDVALRKDNSLQLVVGAGGTAYAGWISAEKSEFDITAPNNFKKSLGGKRVQNILAEHVIEHINRNEFEEFLFGIRPFLQNDSCIRVAVPDALHPSGYVLELTKPGGLEPGADDHKEFYSINIMQEIAQQTGYRLNPIEYFDENGFFHYKEQDWKNGYIARSYKNYKGRFTADNDEYKKMIDTIPTELRKQFFDLGMSYTSLIVDFLI